MAKFVVGALAVLILILIVLIADGLRRTGKDDHHRS